MSIGRHYCTLERVLRIGASLFAALTLTAVLAACGGDDGGGNQGGGEFPDGPAADIDGVWEGTYMSEAGGRSGAFCAELEQDGRELNGVVVFDSDEPLTIGGIIANERVAWTWAPDTAAPATGEPAPSATVGFITGGSFTGDVDAQGDHGSGSFTTLSADHGAWTGARTERGSCD